MPREARLVLYTDLNGRRAGRNDEGLGLHCVFAVDRDHGRACFEIHRAHVAGQELRAEPFCLGSHFLHELRPHDPLGKAGIVLDFRGGRELPAGLPALYEQGREIRPRRIDRSSESSRPRADDHDVSHEQNLTQRMEGMHGRGLGEEAETPE